MTTAAQQPAALPAPATERLIWRADLTRLLGKSSETIRRWMKDGVLPPPDVRPTNRTQAWRVSTLKAAGLDVGA